MYAYVFPHIQAISRFCVPELSHVSVADGILIAKSILNYRMTAHLQRQAALLSRAWCMCTYRIRRIYILCVCVCAKAPNRKRGVSCPSYEKTYYERYNITHIRTERNRDIVDISWKYIFHKKICSILSLFIYSTTNVAKIDINKLQKVTKNCTYKIRNPSDLFTCSMQQRVSMRRHKMHTIGLAMRRSSGLLRSQRRDRMRRMQFQFVVISDVFDAIHHIRQNNKRTFRQGFLHQVLVALRQKKMHVGQSYLRRCNGLSVGTGRAVLL